MKCPMCEDGTVIKVVHPIYQARLKAINFEVKDAVIEECDTCGEKMYHCKEIRRWEQILKDLQEDFKQKYDPAGHAKCEHREVVDSGFSRDFCIKNDTYCEYRLCEFYGGFKKPMLPTPKDKK